MLENSLFYAFSLGLIVCALGVVMARSAVYGVLSLVACMCFLAGLFVLLKAFFVATVLVLVYAGAILVLFLFVVMLVDFKSLSLGRLQLSFSPVLALTLAALLFIQTFKVIRTLEAAGKTPIHGTAEQIGGLLFGRHLLPFELTSFLILAAVVSVVVLAKKDVR
jgi:NADH-quinone oxidoreductase subunit J